MSTARQTIDAAGVHAALKVVPFRRQIAPQRLTRAFWGVMFCFLIHGLVVSTWVARIASVKGTLHLRDGALGLALLGTAIGSVTAIPVCGTLVTRYGSRRIARWTSVGFSLALIPLTLAWNAWTLFAALLLYGAMAGSNDVAMNSQAVVTERLLGRPTMSRFHAMFSLGGIVGAAAGALIAGRGVKPGVHLAIGAACFVAISLSFSRFMIEGRNKKEKSARLPVNRIPLALLVLSAIGFCIFLSEGAIADWTAVYLRQVLGATEGFAPVGYAVFSAAMATFRFLGDAITLRIGRAWTIRLGGAIAASGLLWVVFAHSPYWALVGFAAAGAGFSSIIPLVFAAGGRIPGVNEGAGVATVSGLGYLGFLVGPPAIGFISEMFSLRAGLFLLVVLSAGAAAMVSVVQRAGRGANPLAD
jgi:MFS family permease